MTFLDCLNSPKFHFTQNWSGGKIIKYQHMNSHTLANFDLGHPVTMLQKLSNCEVKAWLCWNLITLRPLQFYVKSNFSESNRSKNVVFVNFRGSESWFLVLIFSKSEQLSSPKFTKMQSSASLTLWTVWICQNVISRKIGVVVKLSNFNKVKP